jgi:hypothetical protein
MIEIIITEYQSKGSIIGIGRSKRSYKSAYRQAYNSYINQAVLSEETVVAHTVEIFKNGKLLSESNKWPVPPK